MQSPSHNIIPHRDRHSSLFYIIYFVLIYTFHSWPSVGVVAAAAAAAAASFIFRSSLAFRPPPRSPEPLSHFFIPSSIWGRVTTRLSSPRMASEKHKMANMLKQFREKERGEGRETERRTREKKRRAREKERREEEREKERSEKEERREQERKRRRERETFI